MEVQRSKHQLLTTDDIDDRALFCAWASRAVDRAGDFRAAEAFIAASRGYAVCSLSHDTWAQVNFISALFASARDSIANVDELLSPALISSSSRIRAQALEWQSILHARAGRRADQAFLSEQAWAAISSNPDEDQYLAANVLFNCAVIALERCDRKTLYDIFDRMAKIEWTESLKLQRFQVMRLAAWGRALDGDHLGAFALWRDSAAIAPSAAWEVLAHLDRAFLAREMNEELFAREELSHALSIAEGVDWESTADQERLVLLWLAEGCAFAFPVIAQTLLARYIACKASMPIHLQMKTDGLAMAPESFTSGVILMALGSVDEAARQIKKAFELWSEADYRWRASQAAVRLLEIGCAGDIEKSYLAEHAPMFPNSWIAARAKARLNSTNGTKDGLACQGS